MLNNNKEVKGENNNFESVMLDSLNVALGIVTRIMMRAQVSEFALTRFVHEKFLEHIFGVFKSPNDFYGLLNFSILNELF